MTTDQEREVADWVAGWVEGLYGVSTGPATPRDGLDGSGLSVDFTFDDTENPIALEVTRLTEDFENPSPNESRKFEGRLAQVLASKAPGSAWVVGVRPETRIKSELQPAVERLAEWMLAANVETLGPAAYHRDIGDSDLLQRMLKVGFAKDCENARLAGVIYLHRATGEGVTLLAVTEFSDSKSLLRPIARAFSKKSASIETAKVMKYVTMLAIDVERVDAHGYIDAGLKVRGFPTELDHVWLLTRRPGVDGVDRAFHASRDQPKLVRL